MKRKVKSIDITGQINKLKSLIILYKEKDLFSWKFAGELLDSLIAVEVIERKIDEIIFNAGKRIN